MVDDQHPNWHLIQGISATQELVAAYAYLIDERFFDSVEALVAPDIALESETGTVIGWSAVRRALQALAAFKATQHFVSNHIGRWYGDDFFGRTYCLASHIYTGEDGDRKYDVGIRYDDHIFRRDGVLRFRRRRVNAIWRQDAPTTGATHQSFFA